MRSLDVRTLGVCSLIYDEAHNQLVMFGGRDAKGKRLNDVWTIDLEMFLWQKVCEPASSLPCLRPPSPWPLPRLAPHPLQFSPRHFVTRLGHRVPFCEPGFPSLHRRG